MRLREPLDLVQLHLVEVGDVMAGGPVETPQLDDFQEVDSRHEIQFGVPAG